LVAGMEGPLEADTAGQTAEEDDESDDDFEANGSAGDRRSFNSTRTGATMESGYTRGTNSTTTDLDGEPRTEKQMARQNKKTEERKQRGMMQWKPARNLKFAADEGKIGLRKLKGKLTGGLEGRQPGVETEAG